MRQQDLSKVVCVVSSGRNFGEVAVSKV